MGAFFTFLVIAILASIYPEKIVGPSDVFGLWSSVLIWAGFLILTSVAVGFTHRELENKHDVLEAGYLAEIGKPIAPENILNRDARLTDNDLTHIHMHLREGVRGLRHIGYEN